MPLIATCQSAVKGSIRTCKSRQGPKGSRCSTQTDRETTGLYRMGLHSPHSVQRGKGRCSSKHNIWIFLALLAASALSLPTYQSLKTSPPSPPGNKGSMSVLKPLRDRPFQKSLSFFLIMIPRSIQEVSH